jgi:hypothetical protein
MTSNLTSISVVLWLSWFAADCITYKHFLGYFMYKIKNILICFKLWIKIYMQMGFFSFFKIYFHNIRGIPSHLLRCTIWESVIYKQHTRKATGTPQKYNTCGTKTGITLASFLELTKHRLQQRKGHSSSLNQLQCAWWWPRQAETCSAVTKF